MPQLESKGEVTRGYLGVNIQAVTPELAKSLHLKDTKGALVADVYQGRSRQRLRDQARGRDRWIRRQRRGRGR